MVAVVYRSSPTDPQMNNEGLVKAKCLQDLKDWIRRKKLLVSDDGKYVRMVKLARRDGLAQASANAASRPQITYKVGETVEAPDFLSTSSCGHGLHFADSMAAAHSFVSIPYHECQTFVVDVELEDAVLIYQGGDKVKARRCKVLWEGNEKNFIPRVAPAARWV